MPQRSIENRSLIKTHRLSTATTNGGEGDGIGGCQPNGRAVIDGQFETLGAAKEPDLIDMHVVLNKTGLSRSSIYRAIREHGFPPAVPMIGRRQLFVRREVEDWVKARIAERRAAAPP
jgi:prophage regulatory protein